jgi:acyl carrier protein
MQREEIIGKLREALAKVLDAPPAAIGPHSRLREDLGLDSFAALEMLFELEDQVGVKITREEASGLVTVEDVVSLIASLLDATAPAQKATGA